MLKIKDNVDLNELEKYGFVKNKKRIWILYSYNYETERARFMVEIDKERGLSVFECRDYPDTAQCFGEFLFDLIQAGLVEKVEK